MAKTLFYDTCSLLSEMGKVFQQEEKFFISSITVNELEGIKTSDKKDEETKYNARKLLHLLERYEEKYEIVPYTTDLDKILIKFSLPNSNDSKIIITAFQLFKSTCGLKNGAFVTKDLACKTIAKSIGLQTSFIIGAPIEEYTGYKIIQLDEAQQSELYSNTLLNNINQFGLKDNQYLIIQDLITKKYTDKYKWKGGKYVTVPFIKAESKMFGKVIPKDGDIFQSFALDSLYSNQITMIRGSAGTGKSYLAFAFLFDMLEKGKIDKIIVFCNTVATKGSAKLGYYPGSKDEKLLDSQIGNLLSSKLGDKAGDKFMVEKLIRDGELVLLPMSDIRGYDTTGMNAAVYISEAQNLDIELMKLALQRIGEDCICILDGDSETQVDSSLYSGSNNGMRRVSEVFRGADFYGEVTLVNIKRSKIANLAQQM